MKKIISTIAMLTLLSSSFAATKKCPVVILPWSHNKDKGDLQLLLEKDGDEFKGIENEIKMDVNKYEEPSHDQKKEALEKANNILGRIGFNKDNMVHIVTAMNKDINICALLFLVNPTVELKDQYVWINADDAIAKTRNITDKNLENILSSKNWTVMKNDNASFITLVTNKAKKKYFTLTFYLDPDKKNIFLQIDKKNKSLVPLRHDFKKFTTLAEANDEGALFKSGVFPSPFDDGQFWRVIFKNRSELNEEEKKKWVEVETKTFEKIATEDSEVKIGGEKYTIDKDIFNALVTCIKQYEGEKKGDAEAGEIVYKFAETLSKLTKT